MIVCAIQPITGCLEVVEIIYVNYSWVKCVQKCRFEWAFEPFASFFKLNSLIFKSISNFIFILEFIVTYFKKVKK